MRDHRFNLEEVFGALGRRMMDDFLLFSGQVNHNSSKGSLREQYVKNHFERWLPKTVRTTGSATIVAASGEQSPQCDICICDPATPLLIDDDSHRVIPVECLFGLIQVKSRLDLAALRDDYSVIRRTKELKKTAFQETRSVIKNTTSLYGYEQTTFPIWSAIFAYDSAQLLSLRDELTKLDTETPLEHRPDMVICMDSGYVMNRQRDDLYTAWQSLDVDRVAMSSDNPLLLPTLMVQEVFAGAWSDPVSLRAYLPDAVYGHVL